MIPHIPCLGAFIFGAAVGAFITAVVLFFLCERAARRHRP